MEQSSFPWIGFSNLTDNPTLNEIIVITVTSLIVWVIWRLILSRLEAISRKAQKHKEESILYSIKSPISTLIWCWPGTVSLGRYLEQHYEHPLDWLSTLKLILVIVVAVWALYRIISNIEFRFLRKQKKDATTVQAVAKIARLFIMMIGVLTVMQAVGLSLSGLLTFGGVGGLIAGFAAKDLLSNFFGGMMIYFDRPFKIGDWVRSPDRNIEGTVERIGWRMTVIRTFEKRPLYVPNSVFSNIVVENPSRMTNRRIRETIGLRYDDAIKVNDIIKDVQKMLISHPDIDTSQTLIVNFNAFGPSSMDFFIYTFTKTVNWIRYHEVKQDVLLKILNIIHEHNADVAFPTQTLKVDPSLMDGEWGK